MYCTKCGKQAAPGDVYCSQCGTRLRSDRDAQSRKRLLLRIGTLVLTLAVAAAGAATLLRNRPQPEQPGQTLPAVTEPLQTGQMPLSETQAPPQQTPEQPAVPSEQETYLSREKIDEYGTKSVTLYRYDRDSRVTWKQTPDGYVHFYSYRSNGTLEKEGISFAEEPVSVILYDDHGNPVQESDLLGYVRTWTYTYDRNNRVLTSEKRDPDGLLEETFFTYSADGSYTEEYRDYAENMLHCSITTSYDAQGRILTRAQDLESGMAVEVLTENVYDASGNLQLTEYSYESSDLSTCQSTEYVNTYTDSGLLEKREVYVSETILSGGEEISSPRKLEKTILYTYDQKERLIGQEVRGEGNDWSYSQTWEYDEAGNLIRSTEDNEGILRTYEYLPLDQLISD